MQQAPSDSLRPPMPLSPAWEVPRLRVQGVVLTTPMTRKINMRQACIWTQQHVPSVPGAAPATWRVGTTAGTCQEGNQPICQ